MFTRMVYGRRNGTYNYSEFLCETESDLSTLPTSTSSSSHYARCAIGSRAFVIDSKKEYILSPGNVWKFFQNISDSDYESTAFSHMFSMHKVEEYLYEVIYSFLDYDYATAHFRNQSNQYNVGGCSSARSGNIYGRNFDWLYSDTVEFVVKTYPNGTSHGTIGIAGQLSALTKGFVEAGAYNEAYILLPFMLTDGINDAGVICNMNVVPSDKGITSGTAPTETKLHEICNLMLPRFILDRFSTSTEAVDYLVKHVSVFCPKSLQDMHYDVHFMIADTLHTFCIEFVENEMKIINIDSAPFMTNFFLYGTTMNVDGSVYTPETQTATKNAKDTNGITDFGSGLERYNIINSAISTAGTKAGMRELMTKLNFTNAYKRDTLPFWYTEFVGGGNTVKSPADDFADIVDRAIDAFDNRVRDGKTWQTNHSAVYDISTKQLSLCVQETEADYEYKFDYTPLSE